MSRAFLHTMLANCAPNAVRAIHQGYYDLGRLPYRRRWVIDTEFRTGGDPHRTWCVSGLELRSGERFEMWTDGRSGPSPFQAGDDTLVIAFVAGAEMACWRQLGWPPPTRILDLFQEGRCCTNTGSKADPQGLVAMCRHVGIGVLDLETKAAMQLEAQTRVSWPADTRMRLMSYCSSDVTATAQLFLALLPDMLRLYGNDPERGLYFTLLRGECAAALGRAELRGLPVNNVEWPILQAGRLNIYPAIVAALSPELRCIYRDTPDGPVFTQHVFEAVMAARGLTIDWPRTPLSDELSTTGEVLHQMLAPVPELHPLVEVMNARRTVALLQWQVGADDRCRTLISPGRTATGRCAPRGREFPFSALRLFRHALQAPEGWVILQCDYAGQESAILGEQAEDLAYLAAYQTGDIHLAAARMCRIVPEDATGETHPVEREQLKTVNHGLAYGARPRRVAAQLGTELAVAEHLCRTHGRVFARTHDYLAATVDTADTYRHSITQDGWSKRIVPPFSATSALNYGVQATGAAALRRGIVLVDRAGLPLIGSVHDSLLFCCRLEDAVEVLLEAERAMVEAGRYFCPGVTLRIDFAASRPVHMPDGRKVKPLADPRLREAYERVLGQARGSAVEVA